MIISVKHDASQLKGVQQQQMDCACPSGAHVNYTVYIFDEGVFLHQGDGGFLNWAFTGNFVRDGDKASLIIIKSSTKLTDTRLRSRSRRRIESKGKWMASVWNLPVTGSTLAQA
jgi:hypothetical protein